MSIITDQQTNVLQALTLRANAGELFTIWNGELYPDTISSLQSAGLVVVPNTQSADPTKQYAIYELQELNS